MFDAENLFSHNQTLADGPSANIVDCGVKEVGTGQPVLLAVILSDGASGGLAVTLVTGSDSELSDEREAASFIVPADRVEMGGTVLTATLPGGCDRYLRLEYAGASGGTVTAGLVQGAETPRPIPQLTVPTPPAPPEPPEPPEPPTGD
jgi:hypothetical protein